MDGKPMISHLHRYQGFAVDDYGFTLDALNLGHSRLSIRQGNNKLARMTERENIMLILFILYESHGFRINNQPVSRMDRLVQVYMVPDNKGRQGHIEFFGNG
jgi:hypothetical protein